jgi:hypothetical protein
MPEPIEITELQTMRQALTEMTSKNAARKARILELETANATLTTERDQALTAHRAVTLDAPVRQLAESLSPVPSIWLEQVAKLYKFEIADGKLSLLTLDGKPVTDKSGKTVEATREGLIGLLIKGDDPAVTKTFSHFMSSTLASGGGAPGSGHSVTIQSEQKTDAHKPIKLSLGIR